MSHNWRRAWLILIAAGALAAASACGPDVASSESSGSDIDSGTGSSAQADAGDGGAAKLNVTFDVEGGVTLKGSTVDTVLPSPNGKSVDTCADYAKGGKRSNGTSYFALPLRLGGDLSGRNVSVNVMVRDYTGPGNFTEEHLTGESSPFGVLVDDKAYVRPTDGAGAIVSTDSSGSGSFYFEKLTLANGGDIAGMISWTCQG
jgi:hypothetical protein